MPRSYLFDMSELIFILYKIYVVNIPPARRSCVPLLSSSSSFYRYLFFDASKIGIFHIIRLAFIWSSEPLC